MKVLLIETGKIRNKGVIITTSSFMKNFASVLFKKSGCGRAK